MKIYLGSDHNGYALKEFLEKELKRSGHDMKDLGDDNLDLNDDFPVFASKVATSVISDSDHTAKGIVLCGSGQGVCMTVNRFKGARGSLCWDVRSARESRNDDDANILCLPAKYITNEKALKIVDAWLSTPFAGAARFKRRIKEMDSF